jgi:hypothetical protein
METQLKGCSYLKYKRDPRKKIQKKKKNSNRTYFFTLQKLNETLAKFSRLKNFPRWGKKNLENLNFKPSAHYGRFYPALRRLFDGESDGRNAFEIFGVKLFQGSLICLSEAGAKQSVAAIEIIVYT